MPFWRCYYHLIWTTKSRQPTITAVIEPLIFNTIRHTSSSLGCELLAVNGTNDHIHCALTIPPALSVSEVVGKLKGVASHTVNTTLNLQDRFYWQDTYGVLTFGEKNLAMVIHYISNQKEHHSSGNVLHYLEKVDL